MSIVDRTIGWTGIVRAIVDPKTSDQDRWILRLALLELAGVEPTTEALAFIGNTTVDKARGAMAVLMTEGLAIFEEKAG